MLSDKTSEPKCILNRLFQWTSFNHLCVCVYFSHYCYSQAAVENCSGCMDLFLNR